MFLRCKRSYKTTKNEVNGGKREGRLRVTIGYFKIPVFELRVTTSPCTLDDKCLYYTT